MSEARRASGASDASVRPALWSDAEALSQMMARAFLDDPLIAHFLPEPSGRLEKLPRIFRVLFKLGLPHKACTVASGIEAAALWRPPNKWHMTLLDYVSNGPSLLRAFGTGALRAMSAMDFIEKHHPKEPHWYLQAVGTDPAKQGKGFGSLVIRDQLTKIDAARMPTYLESSKEANIPIYQSLGFELTGRIEIPRGPCIYPMWRKARYV
jgi:ribosomal protein S18 acetylase RimI-like enzyme